MSRTRFDKASGFLERFSMLAAMAGLLWALLWIASVPVSASNYNAVSDPGAALSNPDSFNIVLLIDKSGSMNSTDKPRHAINAARMFVDSLYTGVQNKRQIGEDVDFAVSVIPFSQDPDTEALPPVELTSGELKDWIIDEIGKIRYDRLYTGATDLGKAVEAAVQRLSNEMDASRTGRIILFTDGYTDYPQSIHENAQALEAQARDKLNHNLALAREKQYEIYVIGLNHKDEEERDSIRPEGVAEIQKIADTTQNGRGLIPPNSENGKNYLITASYAEIQKFYIGVFAYLMQTGNPRTVDPSANQSPPEDNPQELNTFYDIVTDDKTSCVNIYVISEDKMEKAPGIWTPGGTYLYPMESDNLAAVSQEDGALSMQLDKSQRKYAILTLWQPRAGTWRLGLQDPATRYIVQSVPISRNRNVQNPVIAFDANGGSGAMETVTAEAGAPYTLPPNAFTAPDGQRFKGWIVNGEEKSPGDAILVTADTRISAEWESLSADACSVTFDANGGSGAMETVTAEAGASYTLPSNAFTAPDGQRFKGWIVNGEEKSPGDAISVTNDVNVIAQWENAAIPAQGDETQTQGDETRTQDDQTQTQGDETRTQDDQTQTQGDETRTQDDDEQREENFLWILIIFVLVLIILIVFLLFRITRRGRKKGRGKKKGNEPNTDDNDPSDTEKIPDSYENSYGAFGSSSSQSGGSINLRKKS